MSTNAARVCATTGAGTVTSAIEIDCLGCAVREFNAMMCLPEIDTVLNSDIVSLTILAKFQMNSSSSTSRGIFTLGSTSSESHEKIYATVIKWRICIVPWTEIILYDKRLCTDLINLTSCFSDTIQVGRVLSWLSCRYHRPGHVLSCNPFPRLHISHGTLGSAKDWVGSRPYFLGISDDMHCCKNHNISILMQKEKAIISVLGSMQWMKTQSNNYNTPTPLPQMTHSSLFRSSLPS